VSEIAGFEDIGVDERPETRWIMLIKEIRAQRGCTIPEAQHVILANPVWRRWAAWRANGSVRCAKQAKLYIRDFQGLPWLAKEGDRFVPRRYQN
jgi:hypothetical protein